MKNSVYYVWKGCERRMNVYFLGRVYQKQEGGRLGLVHRNEVCEGSLVEQVTLYPVPTKIGRDKPQTRTKSQ